MTFYRVQVRVDEVEVVDAADEAAAIVKVAEQMASPECEWFKLEIDEVRDDPR